MRSGGMICAALLCGVSSAALAADAAAADAVLPDEPGTIIVTGERIARDAQDTRSSVAVTTARDLADQAEPQRIEDVLALVPNVLLTDSGAGPAIRGQDTTGILQGANAFLGGSRPRATIQVDGRALGYNEFIYGLSSVWDVARVEVFRGPQTTSQGRNAIAGAIFIETEAPTFDWQGRARTLVASRDTWQVSGAFSGPILADQIAVRVAGDLRRSKSWLNYGTVTVVGADIRRDDYGLARVKLLVTPQALPGFKLDVTYSHLESANAQGESVNLPFERRIRTIGNGGFFETNVDTLTGRLSYALNDALTFSGIAAYGDSRIERFGPPRGGQLVLFQKDLSLEGVLTYVKDGIELTGGVYRLDQDTNDTSDLRAFLGLGAFTDEQHSFGGFAEATVPLGELIALTAGVRYQRDRQDRLGTLGPFVVDYDRTFDAWLPTAAVSYKPSDAVTLGVSARRGFNPGGTTISFSTGLIDDFDKETLWNYEAFVRSTMLDRRLRLNGTLFYTDIFGAQRPQTTVVTLPGGGTVLQSQVANAPRARSYGVEGEATYTPSRRFSLNVGVGLLDTKLTRTIVPTDPIFAKEFARAPRFTATLGAAWEPIERLRLSSQLRHNSRYFSDDANTPAFRVTPATTVDAKASYTLGAFTVAAYARNALNKLEVVQQFVATEAIVNEPRELGLSVEARF